MFKAAFLSDLHCCKTRKDKCLSVLEKTFQFLKENPMPMFFCGDIWDAAMTATSFSGYTDFVDAMSKIIILVPTYILQGTPTHEVEGSLDVFQHLGARLYKFNTYEDLDKFEIIALPEPRKAYYLSNRKEGESINDCIVRQTVEFVDSVPPKTTLPRICIFHNEVVGEKMVNGFDCSSPVGLHASWLKKLECDFYAGGHIHKAEKISSVPNCYYLGSSPVKNMDELHDAALTVITID